VWGVLPKQLTLASQALRLATPSFPCAFVCCVEEEEEEEQQQQQQQHP
jgi:ribosomal protein L16/L10AE